MKRRPIVAGNWKMNMLVAEAEALVKALLSGLRGTEGVDVVVAPPFPALYPVGRLLRGSPIALAAQNLHWEASGAYTGEVSASMLLDVGCRYVIVGHSERRQYFGETDETANRRVRAALAAGLEPILCVGEVLEERRAGRTWEVVGGQIRRGLAGVSRSDAARLVLAYEPVWAIGTGETATPEQAQEVHARMRALMAELYDEPLAQALRIQYGGSVKADNARGLLDQPDVDGALVGGASLKAEAFLGIIRC
jgi:triosephosphate isomerase